MAYRWVFWSDYFLDNRESLAVQRHRVWHVERTRKTRGQELGIVFGHLSQAAGVRCNLYRVRATYAHRKLCMVQRGASSRGERHGSRERQQKKGEENGSKKRTPVTERAFSGQRNAFRMSDDSIELIYIIQTTRMQGYSGTFGTIASEALASSPKRHAKEVRKT